MQFEKTNIRSILGLRFRDAATERPVTNGLRVSVRRKDGVGRSTQARPTASGAYVAQGLTGLRPYERSAEDVPTGAVDYLVDVRDRYGRFVPTLLDVSLPYTPTPEWGGLYPVIETPSDAEAESNDETPEPICYLFSAVQRPVALGQAVVYADLVVEDEDGSVRPAAHAVLEVRHKPDSANGASEEGPVWYGIADAEGRVAVQFPLPRIQLEELNSSSSPGNGGGGNGDPGNGGPGNGGPGNGGSANGGPNGPPGNGGNGSSEDGQGTPLSTRRWTVAVRVHYEPSGVEGPAGANRPLLPSIFQQERGTLYPNGSTPTAEHEETLAYGSPLILRTGDRSVLRIAPSSGDS